MSDRKSEPEFKYDVPAELAEAQVLDMIKLWVEREEGKFHAEESRTITYFDSKNRSCLENGMTIRRIGGFDPENGDGEKRFRYDFKAGRINTIARTEESFWSDTQHGGPGIYGIFDLQRSVGAISPAARVVTTHFKWLIPKENGMVEVSFDIFRRNDDSLILREIELELVEGSLDALVERRVSFERMFLSNTFPMTTEQKYARVMELR